MEDGSERYSGVVGKEERGEVDMRREDRKGKDERERVREKEGGGDRGRSSKGKEKEEGKQGGGPR